MSDILIVQCHYPTATTTTIITTAKTTTTTTTTATAPTTTTTTTTATTATATTAVVRITMTVAATARTNRRWETKKISLSELVLLTYASALVWWSNHWQTFYLWIVSVSLFMSFPSSAPQGVQCPRWKNENGAFLNISFCKMLTNFLHNLFLVNIRVKKTGGGQEMIVRTRIVVPNREAERDSWLCSWMLRIILFWTSKIAASK